MPRQARLTGIKGFHCYRVDEAAAVSGVSTRTIRNWIKDGLPVLNRERPTLIRGDDLKTYIRATRSRGKVNLSPDQFYCLACRAARPAAGGLADCTVKEGRAMLTALCAACETVMHKPVPVARIPDLAGALDLTITPHLPPDAPEPKEA